jgi:hypothetical protein
VDQMITRVAARHAVLRSATGYFREGEDILFDRYNKAGRGTGRWASSTSGSCLR